MKHLPQTEPTSMKKPSQNLSYLEIGDWKLDNGDCKLENGDRNLENGYRNPENGHRVPESAHQRLENVAQKPLKSIQDFWKILDSNGS